MATTITSSDLTVTISESYSLNGVDYGNTMTQTFLSNSKVSQRIMSVEGKGAESISFTNIIGLGTEDGQGQVVKSDYKYFRITNLDNANNLNLMIYNGVDYVFFQVAPADTLLLMNAGIDATTITGAVTFANIERVSGQSSDADTAIDVEFVMVTA